MPRTPLLTLLLLLAPLAGCIDVPQDRDGASWAADVEPPAQRIQGMTAEESHEDEVGRCEGGNVQVPPAPYCATRVLTVTGRVGVERLPVELLSTNGGVTLTASQGDAWSFVATVKVRALTEEDARRGLDTAWSWSHEDGEGGHRLRAAPEPGVPLLGPSLVGAQYQVALPAWILLDLRAETTNGGVDLQWGEAGRVEVRTTNGAVALHGRAADVSASTTNGGIGALLRATKTGAWSFATTNGGILVEAPEEARQGYDVDAQTTNGRIDIRFEDGEHRAEDRRHHAFRTRGFEARAVQTTLTAQTTNGGIQIG